MKRFLKYFSIVILVVVGFDLLFGWAVNSYVKSHPLPGDYRAIDYLINQSDEDCLILGSSLAINSLMPSEMEDSLGMTCYNGGANAQSIPFYETALSCVLSRHTPRMVIFVFGPNELSGTGPGKRFNVLTPYYHCGHELVDKNLEARDKYERWFLKSSTYRYNKIWWRILLYHFIDYNDKSDKGFVPHEKPLTAPIMGIMEAEDVTKEYLDCFKRCIDLCQQKGIKVVCVFPPCYKKLDDGEYPSVSAVRHICEPMGGIVIDDMKDANFRSHTEWFFDQVHFDIDGSKAFTRQFLHELKKAEQQKIVNHEAAQQPNEAA